MAVMPTGPMRYVRVLDEDPDLGAALGPDRFERARRVAVAPVEEHQPGAWSTEFGVNEPGALGLLVLDGLIAVQITTEQRTNLELLGEGDLIRPWVEFGPETSVPSKIVWTVRTPSRVAFLDARFGRASLAFPEVVAALMDRLVLRVRGLSLLLAVSAVPRLPERLLLALWHFADRWARVTPGGVELRLPLTHEDLSHVVAASRPSVSTALGQLRADGLLRPLEGGGWLLSGEPPGRLDELRRQAAISVPR
jgi:CRP/FNR family transcriptional regulator, cyclic AMP receptor protein